MIFRDLKPENILITGSRAVKLADFGFARLLPEGERAMTVCSTPDYICPELLMHLGCTSAGDMWQFGVLLYELVAGHPPFWGKTTLELYNNILTFTSIFYPSTFHLSAMGLTSDLLVKNELFRANHDQVKAHPWFKDIDWDAFEAGQVKPPDTFRPQKNEPPAVDSPLIEPDWTIGPPAPPEDQDLFIGF